MVNEIPSSLDNRNLFMDTLNQVLGISLSVREIECLAIRFCEFNAKHIAEILHISHRTVKSFFYHADQKLGCYEFFIRYRCIYRKEREANNVGAFLC